MTKRQLPLGTHTNRQTDRQTVSLTWSMTHWYRGLKEACALALPGCHTWQRSSFHTGWDETRYSDILKTDVREHGVLKAVGPSSLRQKCGSCIRPMDVGREGGGGGIRGGLHKFQLLRGLASLCSCLQTAGYGRFRCQLVTV